MKVAVIGTGITGVGIAKVLVSIGADVVLKSRTQGKLEKVMPKIGKISTTTDYKDLADVDIVIESVLENASIKAEVYDQVCQFISPRTIIATNTSSLSITNLASSIPNPERFIGMHFFSPVTKMQLVEVVYGKATSRATIKSITELAMLMGKTPIEVKDTPCFVVNRMLAAYLNEAMWELDEGVASIKDIDTAAKLGLNHPMGPFELMDFIGLDVVLAILQSLYTTTGVEKYKPCPILSDMVTVDGKLGRKNLKGFYEYGGL